MRKTRIGKPNKRVMDFIARHYMHLKDMCGYRSFGLYCSKSYEDIFQDTVLYVSQDEKAATIKTDEEMIEYFCYRFRMIEFQAINDNKMLREVQYAEYIQTKEESKE